MNFRCDNSGITYSPSTYNEFVDQIGFKVWTIRCRQQNMTIRSSLNIDNSPENVIVWRRIFNVIDFAKSFIFIFRSLIEVALCQKDWDPKNKSKLTTKVIYKWIIGYVVFLCYKQVESLTISQFNWFYYILGQQCVVGLNGVWRSKTKWTIESKLHYIRLPRPETNVFNRYRVGISYFYD